MTDLRTARQSAGKCQQDLAALTGLGQPDLSKLESGQMPMTEGVAEKLARHLPGTTASGLVMGNLAAGYKRARERGDRVGVLRAAESVVKYASRFDSDPSLDAALDQLTESAVRFAQGDSEEYGQEPGRDILGRRVDKSARPNLLPGESYLPLWSGHTGTGPDLEAMEDASDEDFDEPGHDGRDAHGIRIAPLGEVD